MKVTQNELIAKLKELRQIQPSKNWASLTKTRILGEARPGFTFFPYFKPALAVFTIVFILFGVFGYDLVKHSLPGDLLYSIRKVVHEGRAIFISDNDKPAFQLKLANERLEDLTKAPVKNLAPTISEFQANMAEAVKNLSKIDATTSSPVAIKRILEETKRIEGNKQKAESLGVVVGEEETAELENALGRIVASLIEDLKESTLTFEKVGILSKMRVLFEEKKYSEALEVYLINQ